MKELYSRLLLWISLCAVVLVFMPVQTKAEENTLQQLINQANTGDTIHLPKGVYTGPLVIEKSLNLVGESGTVIKGDAENHVITITGTSNVTIAHIMIEDVKKQDKKSGVFIEDSQNIYIENVTIKNSYYGIYSLSSLDSFFSHNTITGSTGHFSKKGNGIHLYKTKRMQIDSNRVTNVQDGIYIEEDESSVITNNEISDSRYGMHFMYSENEKVTGNIFQNNVTGIMVMMTSDVKIIDNNIVDNIHYKGAGIILYDVKDSTLTENIIRNNSVGISLQSSENLDILSNQLLNNQIGLTLLANSNSNAFSLNTMSGNMMQVKSDRGRSILSKDGVGNYWDDYDGLDLNGDGVGDTPYIPTSTYAYLVDSQPVFQYFFEAPATVLMNQFDHQLVAAGEDRVKDDAPLVASGKWKWEGFAPSYSTLVAGILLLGIGLIIRRKVVM